MLGNPAALIDLGVLTHAESARRREMMVTERRLERVVGCAKRSRGSQRTWHSNGESLKAACLP